MGVFHAFHGAAFPRPPLGVFAAQRRCSFFAAALFAHRLAAHLDAVRIVHQQQMRLTVKLPSTCVAKTGSRSSPSSTHLEITLKRSCKNLSAHLVQVTAGQEVPRLLEIRPVKSPSRPRRYLSQNALTLSCEARPPRRSLPGPEPRISGV